MSGQFLSVCEHKPLETHTVHSVAPEPCHARSVEPTKQHVFGPQNEPTKQGRSLAEAFGFTFSQRSICAVWSRTGYATKTKESDTSFIVGSNREEGVLSNVAGD